MKYVASILARPELAAWTPLLEDAAREVFKLMLGEDVAIGCAPTNEEILDVTSMVGLAGRVCGVISVRCSARTATLIAARMLRVEVAEPGPETWDAMGEICNMVAGNFKNNITGMGDGCMISVPTVISGGDYNLHPFGGNQKAEVRLTFQDLPILVSIQVHG